MLSLQQMRRSPTVAGRAAPWAQVRAAGGRRFAPVRTCATAAFAGALAVAGALVLVAARPVGGPDGALVSGALATAIVLAVADLERMLAARRRAGALYARRFAELYRAGSTRALSMEEENELWAIAARRLHLCSWQRMLGFEHGRAPTEDVFLSSAYSYLTGSAPASPRPLGLERRAS